MKKRKYDVRILSLKRWNLPQIQSIFNEDYSCDYGEYISFQSHHFVDILPATQFLDGTIPSAYLTLASYRTVQQKIQDIHTVQGMTILGKNDGFWDVPSATLYITFIQLSNDAPRDLQLLRSEIKKVFKKRSPKTTQNKWTLYFSLDFCDVVLLTKDVPLSEYHNILWDLTLVRSAPFDSIRDTFTMYCFHKNFLGDAFKKVDKAIPITWDEEMALSVSLSIQDMEKWKQLKAKLETAKIPFDIHRMAGRYDLNFTTPRIKGEQIIKIFRYVDELCNCKDADIQTRKDTVFGGYEVMFMAPEWEEDSTPSHPSKQDRSFETVAQQVMESLCEKYCDKHIDSSAYVQETRGSLEALLKNGFSEEFVLSVFLPFTAFLGISLNCNADGLEVNERKLFERMNREYFTAMNTLALCTMHNERQFVQAPAFNATYFEVPPKLLAYYSALVYHIANTLCDKEPIYRFVISPDYKNDIFVNHLRIPQCGEAKEHLAVMCLAESSFYVPSHAIALFCHETAHYLSDRKRELRAKSIFQVVALSFLLLTPFGDLVKDKTSTIANAIIVDGKSIINLFAESFASILDEKYAEYCDKADSYEPHSYHIASVREFLDKFEYGRRLIENKAFREKLTEAWETALCEKYASRDIYTAEIKKWVSGIESEIGAYNLLPLPEGSDLYSYNMRKHTFATLARDAVSLLEDQFPEQYDAHKEFCGSLFSAYIEAYADLRMAELIGDEMNIPQYEELLRVITKESDDFSCAVRHNAVCRVVWAGGKTENWCDMLLERDAKTLAEFAANKICDYLAECHKKPYKSPQIQEAVKTFRHKDILTQFQTIHEGIVNYREEMISYCQEYLWNE